MGKMGTISLLSIFSIFLGCGGEAPKPTKVPIPPPAPKVATRPPQKAAPPQVAELKVEPPPPVTYHYRAEGKPDPFKPLVVEKVEAPKTARKPEKVEKEVPGTDLEKMDLSALKLVAVIWGIPNPRAMVEDSRGRGYILSVGTRIGKNEGRVSKINSTGMIVTEKYETSDGKFKTREVPMRLYVD